MANSNPQVVQVVNPHKVVEVKKAINNKKTDPQEFKIDQYVIQDFVQVLDGGEF